MSLKSYRQKRKFSKTPEPKPKLLKKENGNSKDLFFCVQKHAATHLHYDFRIELNGVLLSWAVPKGPSLNPQDKRLAIKVEDHPLDYGTFEGVIPPGNYGAGTVLLWDQGTYSATGAHTKKENVRMMREELAKGHLDIELHGQKLKGRFSLILLKNSQEANAWLLVKNKDPFASQEDVKKLDYSVKSLSQKKKKIPKTAMPSWISPMLAKTKDKPFDSKEWLFEIKWDGYRVLSYCKKEKIDLQSRNRKSFNKLFPLIVEEFKKHPIEAIFDGEAVIVDEAGRSKFELLQNYQKSGDGNLRYYLFDLLYYQGQDLRHLPLMERKEILKKILEEWNSPILRYSDHIEERGIDFFNEVSKKHLEGIIAKRKGSHYLSRRSEDWIKIKTKLRQEVVVGGYTQPKGSRLKVGALLIGVYNKEGLEFIGRVGGGFNSESLKEIYEQMQPLIQSKTPFYNPPKKGEAVTWIKPKLVCEISFAEWTKDGKVRQPIFHGMRIDKDAKDVRKEKMKT